jgi:peptide deformylase
MIREIIKDEKTLTTKSEKAGKEDLYIVKDLLDTATYYQDRCCGLAAVQINELKRIIVVFDGKRFIPMINPIILAHSSSKYITMEGCMSLDGQREVSRYNDVTVIYDDIKGKKIKMKYNRYVSEIIQHEIDHLNGVLI